MRRWLLMLLVAVGVAACGKAVTTPGPGPRPTLIPQSRIKLPPESARTPEGAKPASPPVSPPRAVYPSRHIDGQGLVLIERFEGFSSCPYFDPFGGVWTIGFGVTSGSGASVGPGTPCESHAGAQRQLQALLESRYEWAINALGVPLDQHERDALCSFVWNLGAGIFEGTTVGADLHSRHFYAATRQMLAYDHAGGVLLEGLRVRRQAEVALFLSAEPRPKPAPKPSRAKLLAEREALRRLERRHHCLLPPKYGGGRYHKACEVWRPQGNRIDRELRG